MSDNGLHNYASNQNGWNWWPSNQTRPLPDEDGWNWWPSNENGQGRDQWDQWWQERNQQNGRQPTPWDQQNGRRQPTPWDQQNGRRQPTQRDQQNGRRQPTQRDQQNGRRQPTQWDRQNGRRRDYDRQADWDRFYLTGRPLRNIIILVDPRGQIYILVDRQLYEVQMDSRGRIRIHRDRRDRVWLMVRPIRSRRPQLRTQSSLVDLARANGIESNDY